MTVLDRVAMKAATAYARLTMASPIYRESDAQFEMTVAAVSDLGGGMRRITFSAEEFANFRLVGCDEYFGLLMPRRGAALTLPDGSRENVRAAIADMPEAERPDLRWYTIRAHHAVNRTIDVDIVTHGDSGPGSAWACAAQVGDRVGFRSGGALFRGHECDGPVLFVADETALPALAAIVDAHPTVLDRATFHVEVSDEAILAAYPLGGAEVTVHVRTDGIPGSVVLPALRDAQLGKLDYAWLCGESGMVTEGRRHLVKSVGVDRRQVLFSGYWKLGQERG
ncbi:MULTISPECIES: siderophore-interacting protein [unclassified Knoellia]|uniref:siderophore-interacting protein n=1 Tax=Knoellia altitudinis TaxID=3404795 RepID=UPI003613BD21